MSELNSNLSGKHLLISLKHSKDIFATSLNLEHIRFTHRDSDGGQ